MRTLITTLSFCLAIILSGFSQTESSLRTFPDHYLEKFVSGNKSNPSDGSRQLELRQLMPSYSFTSYQVKRICEGFVTDEARLSFAMSVFPRVSDKENFYIVYDAFGWFSSVIRLYDFVKTQSIQAQQPYVLPSEANYIGPTNCKGFLSAADFEMLFLQAQTLTGENPRKLFVLSVVRNNCITTGYLIRLLAMVPDENQRLDIAKQAYAQLYDLNNFSMVSQLFSKPDLLEKFHQFEISVHPGHGFDPLPPASKPSCQVDETDFASMLESLERQSFNNTKLTLVRQMLSGERCFSVNQIIQLVNSFSFEASRLDIAKHAYDFCSEKDKYFLVVDVFEFEASKNDLLNFLKSK